MAALIALAIISAVGGIGTAVSRMYCGMARTLGGIASNSLNDGGGNTYCSTTLADGALSGSGDTCSGQPVGTPCQRSNANGGLDSVVVVTTNAFYAWPSDESTLPTWNDGSSNWVQVLSPDYTSSATALTDTAGASDTTTLVALGSSSSPAPYKAAQACRAHGPDWYLPALGELAIVTAASGASGVGSLVMNTTGTAGPPYHGYYWSASEYSSVYAWGQYYSGGWQSYFGYGGKDNAFATRCVRK